MSMWTRQQLKEKAKEDLKRSYWGLVLVALIVSMITGGGGGGGGNSSEHLNDYSLDSLRNIDIGVIMGVIAVLGVILLVVLVVGIVLGLFVFSPLLVGAQRYILEAAHKQKTVNDLGVLGRVFSKGRDTYFNVVKVLFFKGLYEGLWTLLFVIPGIIKRYEYRMIPYILAENPDVDVKDAFLYSKEMMEGQKWDAFVLDLSFVGWSILSGLSCGILAVFYVNPYICMTDAELYYALRDRASGNYYDVALGEETYMYGNSGEYMDAAYTDVTYTTTESCYRAPGQDTDDNE